MIAIPDIPDNIGPSMSGFLRAVKNKLEATEELCLKNYTVQQLNNLTASNYSGRLVRCTNGNAGSECLAYCNGYAWYVVELGSKVSIS